MVSVQRPAEEAPASDAASADGKRSPTADPLRMGAIGLGVFLLVKCYAAAHFSLTTAAALLTASPVGVLLGSLTLYGYQFFPLAALAGVCLWLHLWRERASAAWLVATAVGTLLALALSPWWYFKLPAALAAAMLAYALAWRFAQKRHVRRRLPGPAQVVASLLVLGAAFMVIARVDDLWLPVEAIEIVPSGHGATPVTLAYVLTEDGDWTSMLRAGDRGVMRIRSSAILGRRVCHLNGIQPHSRRPLWWWLIGRPYTSPNVGCRRLIHGLSGICLLGGSRPAESDPGLPWPRPCRTTVDLLRKPSAAQPPAAASATAAGASARP